MLDFLRIGRGDGEKLAVWQGSGFGAPTLIAVHCLRPGGDHPLDRDECAPGAGDRDLQTAADLFRDGIGSRVISFMSMRCCRSASRSTFDQLVFGSASRMRTTSWIAPNASWPGMVGVAEAPCIPA